MYASSGLPYHERTIGAGAQTSRPDDAGPMRNLLGGMASPAAFVRWGESDEKVARSRSCAVSRAR